MSELKYFLNELAIKILSFDYFVIRRIIRGYIYHLKYKNVLDVGCGIGSLSGEFSPKKYFGFDIDRGSIKYAEQQNPKYKYGLSDATSFNLKKKYDLILVAGVFHHLDVKDVKSSIKKIRSHLSKNGKVIIIEAIQPIKSFNILSKFLRSIDRGHFIRRKKEYQEIISKELKILKVEEKGGFTFDYASFLAAYKSN
ncbi:MAG: methyltransferase type 11 [uncultured bacterium]|uniref:Methyltransferase type 11 n=3 Tax=Candidatus Daviesiibacteriota TaxID=1752718 RepID=A0A0G0HEV6_9BACT|nr:MAG: methyltransferase type 11 [uncultured bacterium]KKQ10619.1 MAG: Methyltransferase type 11 [Candidatus Daviesbacteria bacterium GW2011_GWB1_36_5]KKQ15750.1 MAG: Methyltransferase type 11 [Candidatus Daviesbacteria bacterium GW2011_GWA1_36_8]OGE17833.1 MAG: hypothetical protein A2858_03760 [Candidatus Daviesbacteria bacterium RIFCSPHIGHO2_01_FULL_36_37]